MTLARYHNTEIQLDIKMKRMASEEKGKVTGQGIQAECYQHMESEGGQEKGVVVQKMMQESRGKF